MNWQHLQAFVWLRWRMLLNEARRGGGVNAVLMMILAVLLAVIAIPLFIGCVVLGMFVFPKAEPLNLLYAWDGMVGALLFFWIVALAADLQRTDGLSPAKFLHLPLSVSGVFFINYLSSLVSLRMILGVSVLFGFAFALPFSKGLLTLVALPLTLAFLLMITALTSQFQGWLAALMTNPRRRRTVIVAVTGVFLLISQLPNLFNLYRPRGVLDAQKGATQAAEMVEKLKALDREFQPQQPDPEDPRPGVDPKEIVRRQEEYLRRCKEVTDAYNQAIKEESQRWTLQAERVARLANMVLPVGWLPLGVMAAAEGNIIPALFGFIGMTLIGAFSLRRAYGTTLQLYQGQLTSGRGRLAPALARAAPPPKPGARRKLESQLPGASEPVSVIALAGLRSLIRAPEAKMMLLTPVIFVVAFGSAISKMPADAPDAYRPLAATGAIALALFGVVQLMANQFGFDRDGFRVFVLCAAPRRDILLGKNLAFAPPVLAMAAILLALIEVTRPLRFEHLLSMAPQFVSMYLLFCLLMNLASIYTPQPIAAGSLRPANVKLLPVLLQMVMVLFLFPLTQAPTLLPLAIERGLEWLGWSAGLPICLLLALAECAAVIVLYRFAIAWQGRLLQGREQAILETLTNRAP